MEELNKNCVGQAMQRVFDSRGEFKATYEDIKDILEWDISEEDAQPYIKFYNECVEELKGFRV